MKLILIMVILMLAGLIQTSFAQSCQCVAFRLDDIQDYWLDSVQTKILDVFQEDNTSLTIGIIGNHFGNDSIIVNKIKESIQHQSPKIEIANHGFNHEDFTKFPEGLQYILMERTNQKVANLLGIIPSIFIPPYNTINNYTIQASKENNFQIISANETQDHPPYLVKGETFHHLPETAITGNLNTNDTAWIGENHKQTFVEIISSLQKYGFAVVVMHPQEYSIREKLNYTNKVNETQVQELMQLIGNLKKDNIKLVTMSEIPSYTEPQIIPSWTRNVFEWSQKGNISINDAYDMTQFLFDNKLLHDLNKKN